MATTNKMMLGLLNDRVDAENVIQDLENAGYNPKDISIVMKDQAVSREIASDTGASVAEGAVGGAATGGIIGGIAGLLIGIGAVTIPGLGALLIGGPIALALGLTGAAATTATGAVTGALAGGLIGALINLGVPERDARIYNDQISTGAILLAIPMLSGSESRARDILESYSATNIRVLTMNDASGADYNNEMVNQAYQRQVGSAGGMAYTPNYTEPATNVFQEKPNQRGELTWLHDLLNNAKYPVTKYDLLRSAASHEADDNQLQMLEKLPGERKFANATEVQAAFPVLD